MKRQWPPQDAVFWYLNRQHAGAPCRGSHTVDVVIIGGGIAGLAAAQAWQQRGKRVLLVEQYFCGSGATGKSSGFITPNAELSLTDFIQRYNATVAHTIWQLISSGVDDIRNNIIEHHIACDYLPQDTLVVATSNRGLAELTTEYQHLAAIGYATSLYNKEELRQQIGSCAYYGGLQYANTFGINGYLYCQAMKTVLQQQGVLIFEGTAVTAIEEHQVITAQATITADFVIICTDRFMPDLGLLTDDVYHAQTFLMISQELTEAEIRTIFPTKNLMVWDTEFIYNYFRATGDNRLLVGGGSLLTTYASKPTHDYAPIFRRLTAYLADKFPAVSLQFEQQWPGLIGISKDIGPIAGQDKNKPYWYYITAAAGLPIAAALGRYSAEHILDGRTDLDPYLSPYRSFPISGITQKIIGTKAAFALSNLLKKNVP